MVYEQEYVDVMNKSSFILAPRGFGPCSYRLFESMQLARPPVIISDAWVEIAEVDWKQCSIRIKESDIRHIPAILNERKDEAVEMGRLARENWEKYFSPGVSLHRIAIASRELINHQYSWVDSLKDYSQFVRSAWHFKNLLRFKKKQLMQKLPGKSPTAML